MTSAEIPAITKKKWSKSKKLIATSVIVSIIVIGSFLAYAMIYAMIVGNGVTGWDVPAIATNKASTSKATTWTIVVISSSQVLYKSWVHIEVKNAAGIVTIPKAPLALADQGFNYVLSYRGFNYTPASIGDYYTSSSVGDYISIGDVFSLDKTMYTQGSTLTLFTYDDHNVFAILTV